MDNKETFNGQGMENILLYNDEYFKYIFKKTEKIVSAVFYTTRSVYDINQKDGILQFIEDKAQALLIAAEKTLRAPESSRRVRLEELHIALIALESALTVGNGARIIPLGVLEVFKHELTSVHKSLKEYNREGSTRPFTLQLNGEEDRPRKRHTEARLKTPEAGASSSLAVSGGNRRDRILAIIKDKGQASIKDVSSVIAECSEKTIQRELMSLISEGRIIKEGERRWSKYSIA